MRPGQAAPEFFEVRIAKGDLIHASMRPGQAAPEFVSGGDCASARLTPSFNEAGAGCPGIPC